ncbi:hypothetical protein D3C85_1376200 [compost metagenome]
MQAVAAVGQGHAGGIGAALLEHVLGQVGAAMAGINRHLVAVRVALEQGDLSRAEECLVLLQVLHDHGEKRLLVGERVGVTARGVDAAGALWQAAGPGWNAAVGVAGLFRAHGRQTLAEFAGIVVLGLDETGRAGQGQHTELHAHGSAP